MSDYAWMMIAIIVFIVGIVGLGAYEMRSDSAVETACIEAGTAAGADFDDIMEACR